MRAATEAERLNDFRLNKYDLSELQANEIRTFTQRKARQNWVFASLEVWSRMWVSTIVGRRSYANTKRVLNDTVGRSTFTKLPLITTDGFKYFAPVIRQILDSCCVCGVVMKMRRKDRAVKVDRHQFICSRWQLEDSGDASWVGEPATVLPRGIYGRGGREIFRCRWNGGCI